MESLLTATAERQNVDVGANLREILLSMTDPRTKRPATVAPSIEMKNRRLAQRNDAMLRRNQLEYNKFYDSNAKGEERVRAFLDKPSATKINI